MKIEKLVVVVKLDNGSVHQILLTKEMEILVKNVLTNEYVGDGVLRLDKTILEGLNLVNRNEN